MKITIHPQAGLPGNADDYASVSGDTITHNGTVYDLSSVPEGGEAMPQGDDHPFDGAIVRKNGEIILAIKMQYNTATAEPIQPRGAMTITIDDGPVPDMVKRKTEGAA